MSTRPRRETGERRRVHAPLAQRRKRNSVQKRCCGQLSSCKDHRKLLLGNGRARSHRHDPPHGKNGDASGTGVRPRGRGVVAQEAPEHHLDEKDK